MDMDKHQSFDSGRDSPHIPSGPIVSDLAGFEVWPQCADEETCRKLKVATSTLVTLQQCHEPIYLRSALQRLENLFKNGVVREYLESQQVHLLVESVMKHLTSHSDVQKIGCQLLCQFTEGSSWLCECISNSDVYKHLLKVAFEFVSDLDLQISTLKIFSVMVSKSNMLNQLKEDRLLGELMDILSLAVAAFREVQELQIYALTIIRHVMENDSEQQEIFMKRLFILVQELLTSKYPNSDVLRHLFLVYNIIARNPIHASRLVEENVHGRVMDYSKNGVGNETLQESVLLLLSTLSLTDSVQTEVVDSGYLVDFVLPLLMNNTESDMIQAYGLVLLLRTIKKLLDTSAGGKSIPQIVKVIFLALLKHMDSPMVIKVGCETLVALIRNRPEAVVWIGENTESKQDPVHTVCLGLLLIRKLPSDVFTAVCDAIYWMTADTDPLSKALMERNSHIAVLQGMKEHMSDPRSVAAAAKALKALILFSYSFKTSVASYGDVLTTLIQGMNKYLSNVTTVTEIISTIACLCDFDIVRHQCLVENVHQKAFSVFDVSLDNDITAEVIIELFAMLAGAARGAEILHSMEITRKLYLCMKTCINNICIQKKGLMLLQLLAEPNVTKDKLQCSFVTETINRAMKEYQDNPTIQSESCVTMLLWAEKSYVMSEELISAESHELLFYILETSVDECLTDLASECLYVLGCEHNLKSRMLVSACVKGYLDGVECLLRIGADVNIGTDEDTPLYNAVKNQNERIVALLLEQENTDIKTSLMLSLKQKCHCITGMLLHSLAQEKHGGMLAWNRLGLGDLKPEWFISFSEPRYSHHSEMGKDFVEKLKTSKEKRCSRLQYSRSDTELLRHKCHRFQHPSFRSLKAAFPDFNRSPFPRKIIPAKRHSMKKSVTSNLVKAVPQRRHQSDGSLNIRGSFNKASRGIHTAFTPEDDATMRPYFSHSHLDYIDWQQSTLTGANIPFHPLDPRRTESMQSRPTTKGPWLRKNSAIGNGHSSVYFSSTDSGIHSFDGYLEEEDQKYAALAVIQPLVTLKKATHRSSSDISVYRGNLTYYPEFSCSTLDLSENEMSSFSELADAEPEVLAQFASLQKLYLYNNQLTEIAERFCQNLKNLQMLDLKRNNLTAFPFAVLECEELNVLDLSYNEISEITDDSQKVHNKLVELDLSHNKFVNFPQTLSAIFPSVATLSLSGNKLCQIDDVPIKAEKLKKLDLSHNKLRMIPEKFLTAAPKLECLEAVNNKIEKLPSENVSSLLPRLYKLKLRKNRLAEKSPFFIPKFILHLPSLRACDLSENGLTGLPAPKLWMSTLLKDLKVSRNQITKLDLESAKRWSRLEVFNISHNRLSEIPKSIGHLSTLSSLDISFNKPLTNVPDELGKCRKLWELPHEGLELCVDESLLKGRVTDFITYLRNKLDNAKPYYRMKLMVVGYGGRGKTTLLRAITKTHIRHRGEDGVTVGVVVRDWKYERQRSGSTVTYTLNTWDFAGQEEFYSTHQCFLSKRALYLVVYDLSRGNGEIEKMKPWLSNIQARAPGCPVVIVGTHYDRLSPDYRDEIVSSFKQKLQELSHQAGFPVVSGMTAVDCTRENQGLKKLRNMIKEVIDGYKVKSQSVMGQLIPASYVKLAECLSEEAKVLQSTFPVINTARLERKVKHQVLDIKDNQELQQAIRFLHESGVLLHYRESALQLKDYYFIDPGWLCQMMAQIVTLPQINPYITKDGIMKKADVKNLFTETSVDGETRSIFPQKIIPQYLCLLEKFEIALPHSEDELLIPCRLPEDKPNINLPDSSESILTRVYSVPYFPIGLWSRLIARLISFSNSQIIERTFNGEKHQMQYWRNGIFVRWFENAFFLLDSKRCSSDELHIQVPTTKYGSRLLGYIVDILDDLIDEWYPGLTTLEPLHGRELLEKFSVCVHCQDNVKHKFPFEDLLKCTDDKQDDKKKNRSPSRNNEKLNEKRVKSELDLVSAVDELDRQDATRTEQNANVETERRKSTNNVNGLESSNQEKKANHIYCPVHKDFVPLTLLAPDVMLSDLENKFCLDDKQFSFSDSAENVLGDGGFGCVYKAHYKHQVVAVKLFAAIGDVHPHKMLRQEATILRSLKHPSVISLIAVGLKPRVIVLDYAPEGSLGMLLKNKRPLSRPLQHRIALQVADGLSYLHSMKVVYRDMKPDNILIFSLSTSSTCTVNARISDYGISRFNTFSGLTLQEGTFAYRAPEVIRGETYSFKADIFSFGLTLYVMVTGGLHPFAELESKGEMDQAIAEGWQIPMITCKKSSPWPDMEAVIFRCLERDPDHRCSSSEINEELKFAELSSLQAVLPISLATTVECLAYRKTSRSESQVWIGSGDQDSAQLSWFSPEDTKMEIKGCVFKEGRVLCLCPLSPYYIIIGTQSCKLCVYHADTGHIMGCSRLLPDSVLCILHVSRCSGEDVIFAGLASGTIACFTVSGLLQHSNYNPDLIEAGKVCDPVKCMVVQHDSIIASCGTRMVFININKIVVEKIVDVGCSSKDRYAITSFAIATHLYLSKRNSSIIEVWDISKPNNKLREKVDICSLFSLSKSNGRVTALAHQNSRTLWVGTGCGKVAILEIATMRPVIVTHRHTGPVRCILPIENTGCGNNSLVVTGGLGFRCPFTNEANDDRYGCISVWDGEFASHVKNFQESLKRREELFDEVLYNNCM